MSEETFVNPAAISASVSDSSGGASAGRTDGGQFSNSTLPNRKK